VYDVKQDIQNEEIDHGCNLAFLEKVFQKTKNFCGLFGILNKIVYFKACFGGI